MLGWGFMLIFLATDSHSEPVERIVGGNEVDINDFPYQLSVRKGGMHICGGALISATYGLSAQHCFRTSGLYSVRAGSNLKDTGGIVNYIKRVILYPKYVGHPLEYDIAIMEFQEPFVFSPSIQPVKLPQANDPIEPGSNGVISGFGDVVNAQNTGSYALRAAEVSVQNFDSCRRNYSWLKILLTSRMFCASLPQKGRDSCQGDSGGPFVINNVLYGLVSFGLACADPRYPGVYLNVATYRDFIKLNTGV